MISPNEPKKVGKNPIITSIYTADPAPMVDGDTLYLYTTHDEDELINAPILEVDFAEPSQDLDVEEAGFFADFANGRLFGVLAGLDVTLRNSPSTFRILDQQNLDVLLVFAHPEHDSTRGRFTHDFLNGWLFKDPGGHPRGNSGAL